MENKDKKTDVYVINPENFRKFEEVQRYFGEFVEEGLGRAKDIELNHRSLNGMITIEAEDIDMYRGYLSKFSSIVNLIDELNISHSENEMLNITAYVYNVWEVVSVDE